MKPLLGFLQPTIPPPPPRGPIWLGPSRPPDAPYNPKFTTFVAVVVTPTSLAVCLSLCASTRGKWNGALSHPLDHLLHNLPKGSLFQPPQPFLTLLLPPPSRLGLNLRLYISLRVEISPLVVSPQE